MDEISRQRVKRALCLDGPEQLQAIESLSSSEQLHQFLLNYNINDGYLPVRAIVNHKACDKGSALYVYWQFPPELRITNETAEPDYDAAGLLNDIRRRLDADSFGSAEYYYDPSAEFTAVQLYKLRKSGNTAHLESVGSRKLEREWLP
ncbi:hypothetical protein C3942_20380 [Solimonas fluminis]|uniref:DUF4274 domain-containing protein n=1 Tax=Solimonas fluminis TaxID=2086571 RepID=A0A2S5TAQ6_9GAMM|nr:DUF4274 domain-containing protein [Solimonas fluminis]PPE72055.1 hypothetical protein C3942_20380 [Solimonas fluminis]